MSQPKADVVLVVKGAGLHKPDETLDTFLQGFLPAVKRIDPQADVRQVDDADIFKDFPVSPHTEDAHLHLTEIELDVPSSQEDASATERRRIWVKEVYWENELHPISPWKAFFIEWNMATYALRRDLTLLLHWVRSKFNAGDECQKKEDRFGYASKWISYTLLYFLLFSFFVVSYRARFNTSWFESVFWWSLPEPWMQITKTTLVLLVATIIAWPIGLRAGQYFNSGGRYGHLQGLPTWVMLVMLLSFVLFTSEYLVLLVCAAIPPLVMNGVRAILWSRRPAVNTDLLHALICLPDGKRHRIAVPLVKLYYRLVVVLALPILVLIIVLAKVLKWTRVLGAVGDGIENLLASLLGGILGDVSSYAMNPAQALRVRSVVENEIAFFARCCPEVGRIHVFAHSQGTAITFETLFTQLSDAVRERIHTYVTIGSILSYYNQTAPILESVYPANNRFRLPEYPRFAPGFRWYNCWNLLDPITEFYGLDEFDKGTPESPRNIKTRARFHSDYWINVDEVQLPFVRRVLGIRADDDFWTRSQMPIAPQRKLKGYTVWTDIAFFAGVVVSLVAFGVYLYPRLNFNLWQYGGSFWTVLDSAMRNFDWYSGVVEAFTTTRTATSIAGIFQLLSELGSDVLTLLVVGAVILQACRGVWILAQVRRLRENQPAS